MSVTVSLTLNGKAVSTQVEPRTLLSNMLRDRLGLTGTHVGCDTSQCGACVVHVNGVSVKSCTMLAVQTEGADVTTIEGLARNGDLHPMQAAFKEHHALQCGFCTPGMIMSGLDLLRVNPSPSEPEIREWLEGNFCRCTGYHNIVKAIKAGASGAQGAKTAAPSETGIGAAVRRKEDQRFITGNGHYLDDLNRAGQCYAVFVRSPHAHAKFTIDTGAAAKSPGVVAVYTGADIAADKLGGLICGWTITQKNGGPHKAPPYPLLATDTVRHVGDALAVVIAASDAQARDAADKVAVRYEEKPAVTSVRACLDANAPQVHAEAPGNLCFDWEIGDKQATDKAFAGAHHVTELELVNNRVLPNAIEPRAALAEYDAGKDEITLYTTSQNPHIARLVMSAFIQLAPEHKLRVISPDLGGGFGSKIFIYPEETVAAWAARKIRRPIKWTAERSESFMTDRHGRDHYTRASLALDKDGKFLGMRVSTLANLGAYLSTFSSCVPTYLYGTLMQGQYTTGAIYCEVKGVFTHTTPVDAVRGAGRPEATYVVERLVEQAAREMKLDPVEIRRRNFIPANAFPYQTQVALQYDSGNYEGSMGQALGLIDYKGFAARRDASKAKGKLRGIGFSAYIEACGIAPSAVVGSLGCGVGLYESAQVRFNPTGNVVVYTGSHSHGQGHETTFAQIVSDRLGVPIENVEVVHGDTAQIPFAMGTYGSRSLAVGGSAITKAIDKIIAKGKKIAAHTLEVAEADLVFEKGNYSVKGTDKKMDIAAVAFAAYVPHNYPADLEPGLDEAAFYDPANFTFPAGTHACEVEVDPETGVAQIVVWVAADDFGNVINPMIVEGQVHGGIAHGVGQAMLEACRYDEETGQLLTGSYLDYCMPRADTLPELQVATQVTPCPHNPLGVKGCGEAGAIAAPAALINALADAIGGRDLSMPATPETVWQAMRSAD